MYLKKSRDGVDWAALIWLRLGTNGGILSKR